MCFYSYSSVDLWTQELLLSLARRRTMRRLSWPVYSSLWTLLVQRWDSALWRVPPNLYWGAFRKQRKCEIRKMAAFLKAERKEHSKEWRLADAEARGDAGAFDRLRGTLSRWPPIWRTYIGWSTEANYQRCGKCRRSKCYYYGRETSLWIALVPVTFDDLKYFMLHYLIFLSFSQWDEVFNKIFRN